MNSYKEAYDYGCKFIDAKDYSFGIVQNGKKYYVEIYDFSAKQILMTIIDYSE